MHQDYLNNQFFFVCPYLSFRFFRKGVFVMTVMFIMIMMIFLFLLSNVTAVAVFVKILGAPTCTRPILRLGIC